MPVDQITKVLSIRECGHNESWLRDEIAKDPPILGLGDLVFLDSERRHSEAGRLDLLLEQPRDRSRYEVELQLGETDPSHIIRTIEYWGREKKRSPRHKHIAVLVAEKITSRFFNVVQLLGDAVPLIGIQVNVVQVGGTKALHFTTIINTSAGEEADEVAGPPTDEIHWRNNYPAAYECAAWYQGLLRNAGGDVQPKFTKGWITLYLNGKVRVSVPARKSDQVQVYLQKLNEQELDEVEKKLNAERTVCTRTEENHILVTGKLTELKETLATHEWVAQKLVKER
jgi:hypothetical protein